MKHPRALRLASLAIVVFLGCGSEVGSDDEYRGGQSNEAGGAVEGGASSEGGAASVGGGGTSAATGGEAEGGAAACPAPPAPKSFELGTGEDCFERISDGGVVPLIQGPQGGYHVWVAFGCADCPAALHAKFGANDVETGMPLPMTYETEAIVDLEGEPFRQFAGIILRMPGISWDPENYPPLAQGTRIELWAQHIDDQGEPLAREARELEIGETVEWNPCIEEPKLPECQSG